MAILKRYTGTSFPPPENGSERLKKIVMKACAYEPSDRYQSAGDMLRALEALKMISDAEYSGEASEKKVPEKQDEYLTMPLEKKEEKSKEIYLTVPMEEEEKNKEIYLTVPMEEDEPKIRDNSVIKEKKKSKGSLVRGLIIGAVGLAAVCAVTFFLLPAKKKRVKDPEGNWVPVVGEAYNANVAPMPDKEENPVPVEGESITLSKNSTEQNLSDSDAVIASILEAIQSQEISLSDLYSFGSYEQDNDTTNGAEPIKWEVLDIKDGKILLVSKYGLDAKAYNKEAAEVTWETCSLRQWLNNEFFNKAFSEVEREKIEEVFVINKNNGEYGTPGGNDTKDKIFLLSLDEISQYYGIDPYSDEQNDRLKIKATEYAVANGAYVVKDYDVEQHPEDYSEEDLLNSWWWLRSPGINASSAATIRRGGATLYSGGDVDRVYGVVRPALWVKLRE